MTEFNFTCPNCGSAIEETAKFCTNCGQPVQHATTAPIAETPPKVVYVAREKRLKDIPVTESFKFVLAVCVVFSLITLFIPCIAWYDGSESSGNMDISDYAKGYELFPDDDDYDSVIIELLEDVSDDFKAMVIVGNVAAYAWLIGYLCLAVSIVLAYFYPERVMSDVLFLGFVAFCVSCIAHMIICRGFSSVYDELEIDLTYKPTILIWIPALMLFLTWAVCEIDREKRRTKLIKEEQKNQQNQQFML